MFIYFGLITQWIGTGVVMAAELIVVVFHERPSDSLILTASSKKIRGPEVVWFDQ